MIVVLGSFDGFHKGHQTLFREAKNMAIRKRTNWCLITFTPHPQILFSSENARLLFLEKEKRIISRYLGIPNIISIPFDKTLASLAPEAFLEQITARYSISGIVVGDNFKFGRQRTGNIDFLNSYAVRNNITFSHVPPLQVSGNTISSTMIRGLVSCGEVEKVSELLGYDFFISSKVIEGDKRGRRLGYPTANLYRDPHKVVPAEGVYAAVVFNDGKWWPSAVNIGYNPTFGSFEKIRIEAHLLDYMGDLYGKTIHLAFLQKIRGELAFKEIQFLKQQIQEDKELTRQIYEKKMQEKTGYFPAFSNAIIRI